MKTIWQKVAKLQLSERMQLPTVCVLNGTVRIYYTRRINNKSEIAFVETDGSFQKTYQYEKAVLKPGEPGSADDAGAMVSQVQHYPNGDAYILYTGWTERKSVPHHTCCMRAIIDMRGHEERVIWQDRNLSNPLFTTIMFEAENGNRYWASGVRWFKHAGRWESVYSIRESRVELGFDGRPSNWVFPPVKDECLVRAWVEGDEMFYCYRPAIKHMGYKIGYATRTDGKWQRRDENFILRGEDSRMTAYPCLFNLRKDQYMIYNTDFGMNGVHIARRES